MGKRRDPRVAYSEYVNPHTQQNIAIQQARGYLLDAVRLKYKPMLKSLSSDVFPHFREIAESGFDFDRLLWHPDRSPSTMLPDGRLKSALYGWAKQFHADEDWFLDQILRVLRGWWIAPEWHEKLEPRIPIIASVQIMITHGRYDLHQTPEPFSFSFHPWDPEWCTWTEYKRKLREEFNEKVEEYEHIWRNRASLSGLAQAPRQYSPNNLGWFVAYQFQGLSCKQIADRDRSIATSESTILKGIHAAARLIGWTRLRSR